MDYTNILKDLKDRIRKARYHASISVNTQLLNVYYNIGIAILQAQKENGWGAKVIDKLSSDLRQEFPEMRGLSPRNLKYMRAFADAYSDVIVQVELAQLSWYHHITLLDKVKDKDIRSFYIQKTIENGWTRDIMVHQIETNLHLRLGNISHNVVHFTENKLTLQIFKDPYYFDFIQLAEKTQERDLEKALIDNIQKTLMELGAGFAFVGSQYKVVLGEHEYFFDLLFYHLKLRRYIVVDLKIGDFKPEYVGKMSFYLNIADDTLKNDHDGYTIGLILCKTKDRIVAEYALRDISKPIGIAEYKIAETLPLDINKELPSIATIEEKLS